MIKALSPHYDFVMFTEDQIKKGMFDGIDIVAFPGGIGDSDSYYTFFRRKIANIVADYIDNGGRYLGICMGAYWAGEHYFDLIGNIRAVQYIKRPNADIRRSYSTTAKVKWKNKEENMFFYDGCALIGADYDFDIVATYANGDPMAIIKDRIGLIGCHPESEQFWFNKKYLKDRWHEENHHKLLLDFVDDLMKR